jgi:hypothetical protein
MQGPISVAAAVASPTASGGAGNTFETRVIGAFVVYMLCGLQSPRLPPGRITTLRCQSGELGYSTDDLLVTAVSEAATVHRLAAHVRLRVRLTAGDEAFSSALRDCWKDFGKPSLIDGARDKVAIITGLLPSFFASHVQPVLSWARTSSTASEFLRKVAPAGGGSERKQQFVDDVRAILGLDRANEADDDRLWRFLKVLEIISLDFDVPDAASGSDVMALLNRHKAAGSPDASLLWAQIVNVADRYKSTAGTLSAESLPQSLGPLVATAFPDNDASLANNAVVQKFRALSQVGVEDANSVGKDAEGRAVLLGEDLYVSRDQESAILELVTRSDADRPTGLQVQIVGEAGYGKTSLLWHLFHEFASGGRLIPVFLKAWLFAESTDQTRLELLDLITTFVDLGRPCVLLIDTVDVLMHEQKIRDQFNATLTALLDTGTSVLVTSRPQEANSLPPTRHRVNLGSFSETELPAAIENYSRRFHRDFAPEHREAALADLREAMAQGLPVSELCIVPLTLRMLFVLYAPHGIPREIDIHQLYSDYWKYKVERDQRGGEPLQHQGEADCSSAALRLGIVMLAEGQPEVQAKVVGKYVGESGTFGSQLRQLVQRSIVSETEYPADRTFRFFHQTFFEHVAARALLANDPQRGLELLESKLNERPGDLFLSAVLEQALLLCDEYPRQVREIGRAKLVRALTNASPALKHAGTYAYVHKREASEDLTRAMRRLVDDRDTMVIERLLATGANMARERTDELIALLFGVLAHSNPGDTKRVFDLLDRCVEPAPERVLPLIKQLHFDKRIKDDTERYATIVPSYLRLVTKLAPLDKDWAWDVLVALYRDVNFKFAGARTHMAIIRAFKGLSGLIGDREIFTRFKLSVGSLHSPGALVGEAFTTEVADMQANEWQARGLPVDDVMAMELPTDTVWLHVHLSAIAFALHRSNRDRIEEIAIRMASGQNVYAATMWLRIGLQELIRAAAMDPSEAFRCRAKALTKTLYGIARVRKDKARTRLIMEAMRSAGASDDEVLDLVSADDWSSEDFWRDLPMSGDFLLPAIRKGNELARDALLALGRAPPAGKVALQFVGATLLEYVLDNPGQMKHFVDFAIGHRDTKHVRALLERLPDDALPRLSAEIARLAVAKDSWLKNTGGQTRRQVVQIWAAMIQRRLLVLPPWREISHFAQIQADKGILTTLFELMELGVSRNQYSAKEVVEAVAVLCPGNDQCMDSGIETICKIGFATPEVRNQCLDLVVGLTFPRGGGSARVSSAQASLLEVMAVDHSDRALKYVNDFLEAATASSKTSEIFRTIESKWRGPLRRLMRVLKHEQVEELARLVPTSPEPIGHMIVDAICRIRMNEHSATLDAIHGDSVVPIRVRRLISNYKYNKERTAGSSVWPEIYETLRPERVLR